MSPVVKGLTCRCPACGRGALFKGILSLQEECSSCGQKYDFADAGDGPAVFIIFIVGFIVVTAALIVEINYQPAYWIHAVLWLPLTLILSIGLLRPSKSLLIALQFHHKAKEGQKEL